MLIKKGAEANIYLEPFARVLHPAGEGKVVVKDRIPKRYRVPELDKQLRESRTALEAKLLSDAKRAGVHTPIVYEVDMVGMRIVMEFVDGKQVKVILDKLSPGERKKLCSLAIVSPADGQNPLALVICRQLVDPCLDPFQRAFCPEILRVSAEVVVYLDRIEDDVDQILGELRLDIVSFQDLFHPLACDILDARHGMLVAQYQAYLTGRDLFLAEFNH